MRTCLFLLLALAACATPGPPTPTVAKPAADAAVCRDPDGQLVRTDPKIGFQTGLPVPRSIHAKRSATFRAGPSSEDAVLFVLERSSEVVILRECEFFRLVRVPDGRKGWVRASALTTRAPKASR
jgi:SH3-like domain-containing protein